MISIKRSPELLALPMILVAADYCPFSQRCILALTAKGIAFEIEKAELSKKAAFLEELSPYGRVPVLKHGARAIYESSVINEYLEDIYPVPALLPAAPWRRAEARFWIDFCNTRFMPAYFNLLKAPVGAGRDKLRSELLDHLSFMDREGLSPADRGQPYWMGQAIGLVDIAFYPFFERFVAVEAYRSVEIPAGLKHLHAWLQTMREHPAVRAITKPRAHYIDYFRPYFAD